MKVAVLQPGSRRSYAIPVMLFKENLLFKLYTDLFISKQLSNQILTISEFFKLKKLSKYLQSRTSSELSLSHVTNAYYQSIYRLYKAQNSKNLRERLEANILLINSLCQLMLSESKQFDTIYAFISGAAEAFSAMPDKIKILDVMHLPHSFLIPHLRNEYRKFPDWVRTIDPYSDGAEELLIAREEEELRYADIIIAPSQFVLETLQTIRPQKTSQIFLHHYPKPIWMDSYSWDLERLVAERTAKFEQTPLKVLFVGTVNLRKGIQYLLPALRLLKQSKVEAKIIGNIDILSEKIAEYSDICEFKGAIGKAELAEAYRWADLFVFPSIAEGSAGVVYEALSFGLPVITTLASGSVVRDGLDGFVLENPSVEAVAEKIEFLYENRELLEKMSFNALHRVDEFSLNNCATRFSKLLKTALPNLEKSYKCR